MSKESKAAQASESARKKIVAFLKNARIEQGLTQKDVEGPSGIVQARISEFEKGETDSQFSTIYSIADALGFKIVIVPKTVL